MKHVLIISPHFPPINAADMHRVRQTLPYLAQGGWKVTVVASQPTSVETDQDPLLLETVPSNIKIIHVPAFSIRWTRKLGLGSLALRSLYFYWKTVNALLKKGGFDLIYFSTTQFPLLILGNYWKKRFGVPYIIDMQDPWHSDYYQNKPKHEQPPKYWFSYRLNKWLEPIAMKRVDALIAVSGAYIDTLRVRYPHLCDTPGHMVTFGAFEKDFEVLRSHPQHHNFFQTGDGLIHWLYVGAAGHIMQKSLNLLFKGFALGLKTNPEVFSKVRFHFIGTNYAPTGQGKATVKPLADLLGVGSYVAETTDRIPYFQALQVVQDADALLILGSDDPNYSASKIYPYILAKKPILAFVHVSSNAVEILKSSRAAEFVTYGNEQSKEQDVLLVFETLQRLLNQLPFTPDTNWVAFQPHTAEAKAKKQVDIFESVLQKKALPV